MILAVTATGTGIAPGDLPLIFDRFYHVDSRVRHTGLATCKAIVEAEGGRIEATSTLHVGTRFTVWLPSTTT